MTNKQAVELLALLNKLKIESDHSLSKEEKELWKWFVDEIKKQAK